MEYSQKRDGRWEVYMEGDWIGTAKQTPSGGWVFLGRFSSGAYGMGSTIDGAIYNALKEANVEGINVHEQVQTH